MNRWIATLAVASLALTGCGSASAEDQGDGPLIIVLFDVSQSTRDVRDRYVEAFDRVLAYAAEHRGHVVADVIDDNPLAHSAYPIDVTFDGCSLLTENPLTCDAEATATIADATAAARAIVEGHAGDAGTDILGGLRLAERVVASYPEAEATSLVVLSDMVARSPQLALNRAFIEARIDGTVAELQAQGSVPDLGGVEVYVVGAGVASGDELPGAMIVTIQRFWEALFAAAGSELRPERYGAALVRFP